ncbi:hypothetical protein, partial [Acinetobacter baumannii]|uniref:hypothetical protein n=1 Tax=Acinetobacter baumannii TaxID=470 RepID=UPI00197ACE73
VEAVLRQRYDNHGKEFDSAEELTDAVLTYQETLEDAQKPLSSTCKQTTAPFSMQFSEAKLVESNSRTPADSKPSGNVEIENKTGHERSRGSKL